MHERKADFGNGKNQLRIYLYSFGILKKYDCGWVTVMET